MTTQLQPHTGADIWTAGGPFRFTREQVITGPAAESLYRLYRRAFGPLRSRAAARQVLTRNEFLAQLEDHRIDKYVAWEGDVEPIGIVTVTRNLDAIPWISPEYFADRFPEQWARKAIYYLGFTLVRPATRRTSFLDTIVRLCVEPLVAEKAVIAYDVCSYNNDVLGFSTRIAEVLRRFSHSQPQELDSQIYYGVNFA
jgi:hypothetical protein